MKALAIFPLVLLFGLNINGQEILDDQYMNAYIVISDTSQNYEELRQKMFDLHKHLNSEIDTMGRGFSKKKNRICLPENEADEIYAGQYYPRRYPSETLSLEYLNYYTKEKIGEESTIALVILITESQEKAENKLVEVKEYAADAFMIKSKIYIGCMH